MILQEAHSTKIALLNWISFNRFVVSKHTFRSFQDIEVINICFGCPILKKYWKKTILKPTFFWWSHGLALMTLIHCSLQLIQQVHTLNGDVGVGGTFLCLPFKRRRYSATQCSVEEEVSTSRTEPETEHLLARWDSFWWRPRDLLFFRGAGGGLRVLILQDPAANAVEKHQAVTPDADDY